MTTIRGVGRNALTALDRRRRMRIRIPATETQSGRPKVYFLAPDTNVPAGGIRVMYRQTDILNAAGIRAAILHQRPGFRCTWFDNETEVTDCRTSAVGPQDLLVISELDVEALAHKGVAVRHVILNQSGMMTWKHGPETVSEHYDTNPGLQAILTVSEYAEELLSFAFPRVDIRVVQPSVDPDLFAPAETTPRKAITYMPRRGLEAATMVRNLLRGRPSMRGWTFQSLEGISQGEVATALRASSIFLSLSTHEGFGLPAAEAMACGNYVTGFHGFGGREFFRPEFSGPVESGDVLALVCHLHNVMEAENEEPGWLRSRGLQSARFIASHYSPEREAERVVRAFQDLI